MNGATHILIGAFIGVQLVQSGTPLEKFTVGALCAGAALLPDVDHPNAVLRTKIGVFGSLLFGRFSHRGITHSATALALVAVAALLMQSGTLALALVAGYASHLLADLLTMSGIALFAPFSARRVGLRWIRTGGLVEEGIALALFIALVLTAVPIDWNAAVIYFRQLFEMMAMLVKGVMYRV